MDRQECSFTFPELDPKTDAVEIVCNIDDMTGEQLGHVIDALLAKNALDVSCIPILMKKGRPAYQLVCLAKPADAHRLALEVIRGTTTNGVRFRPCHRLIMEVESYVARTSLGSVRVKRATGHGAVHIKPEADDIVKIADQLDLPFHEVQRAVIEEVFESSSETNI